MTSCGTTLGGGLDGVEAPRVKSRLGLNDGSLLTLQWVEIASLNDAVTLTHPMLVILLPACPWPRESGA